MSEGDNIELVKRAYGLFQRGEIESLLGMMSDNVEWELPRLEMVPFTGKRTGREQVGQFFSMLAEAQEVLQFEPREYIAERDKVVALGHYAWSVRATDRNFESDWAHVFTIRGGQVVAFREYADTAAAAAAYQPRS